MSHESRVFRRTSHHRHRFALTTRNSRLMTDDFSTRIPQRTNLVALSPWNDLDVSPSVIALDIEHAPVRDHGCRPARISDVLKRIRGEQHQVSHLPHLDRA